MGKKTRLKHRRQKLISETRARLIPASDDIANEIRARTSKTTRIVAAAKSFVRLGRHASDDILMMELLTHLRRYCAWKGLVFEKLDEAASDRYSEEAAEESEAVLYGLRQTRNLHNDTSQFSLQMQRPQAAARFR